MQHRRIGTANVLRADRRARVAGTTKNDDARIFPMTVALREALEEQQRVAAVLKKRDGIIPRYVFTKQNGNRIGSFQKAWKRVCIAAACPGRIVHDFRRTAVRNLVRAGIPEAVAMKMTGHKTRSVFERYNIVSPGDLRDAARKLDVAAGQGQNRDKQRAPQNIRAGA